MAAVISAKLRGTEIPNPKSQIPNPKSQIPNPKSQIPDPKSQIRNPQTRPFGGCCLFAYNPRDS
jgi:hypothetical protein